jgi:predicted ester cyclase
VCSGHHQGRLLGAPATGRTFRYHIAAFFTASDGLLTEAWVLGDLDSLRDQLTS